MSEPTEAITATTAPPPEKENKAAVAAPPVDNDAATNKPTTTTTALSSTLSPTSTNSTSNDNANEIALCDTLFRITKGLPRRELNLMVTEADECETLLLKDISVLEQALAKSKQQQQQDIPLAAQEILDNALTPMDRYWTASALIGRLREDWMLPSILQGVAGPEEAASIGQEAAAAAAAAQRKQLTDNTIPPPSRQMQALLNMALLGGSGDENKNNDSTSTNLMHQQYIKTHETRENLLAVWKKISMHRSSLVFKRPVKPEEAPGYTERIVFPMDLSMIRKLIVARHVKSYQELHEFVGLIVHNCVKYNGRESDYGNVAREFEAAADELILQAVEQAVQKERAGSTISVTKPNIIETVSSGEAKEIVTEGDDTAKKTDAKDVAGDE